ncbi:arginine deiminase-related protein [Nocardioides zeae]|uniref:Arginine deiminase-related protein n=1 Tax=Nocardioides imazamoxiresistens TaxID=3231893 RepID=A0ABU3PUB0_9ACTN|nr:arginine deiminase-related protein [Nocardioides zeae]MDT9592816.1 arginine deiminase-related protein [Nocardioides zeae]
MRTELMDLAVSSVADAAVAPTAPVAPAELPWGRAYLAVSPDHFRVDYVINPFMDPADQPDPERTRAEWHGLVAALRRAGARVDVLRQRADSPDMVYAMNLGLPVTRADGSEVLVASHMRYPERRQETSSATAWALARGREVVVLGADGVGPHLEAGDMFAFGGELVAGFGPRTEEAALLPLAQALGVRVRGLRITHPGMYHLDLAFCPLDERRAMVCPAAFDDASARALLDLVPDPLVLTEAEALTFCANSVVVGRTVLMPACPPRVRARLEEWGFEVVLVAMEEFHKGGGSVRCLTNPLDVVVGRDLTPVPGGEVVTA